MKAKLPELELAVDGFINPQQAGKIAVIKAHIKNLETRKAELESLIFLRSLLPISNNSI